MIATAPPDHLSALNVLPGTVVAVEAADDAQVEIALDCGGIRLTARLTRKSVGMLGLAVGRNVYAVIKSVALDRESLGRAPAPRGPGSADATTQTL
jgi:molybdate transport system ATP-binding protein